MVRRVKSDEVTEFWVFSVVLTLLVYRRLWHLLPNVVVRLPHSGVSGTFAGCSTLTSLYDDYVT